MWDKTEKSNVIQFPGNLSETRVMNQFDQSCIDLERQAAAIAAQAVAIREQTERPAKLLGDSDE